MKSQLIEVNTENFTPKSQKGKQSPKMAVIKKSQLAVNINRALNQYLKEPKITVFSEIINFFKKNKYENVEYYQLYNYILNKFSSEDARYILAKKNPDKSPIENLIDEIDYEFSNNTSLKIIKNKEERHIELDLMKALDYLTNKNLESKFANIKKEKEIVIPKEPNPKKEKEMEIEETKNDISKNIAEVEGGPLRQPQVETTYLAKKTKREEIEEDNDKNIEKQKKEKKIVKRPKVVTLLEIGDKINKEGENKEDNEQDEEVHEIDQENDDENDNVNIIDLTKDEERMTLKKLIEQKSKSKPSKKIEEKEDNKKENKTKESTKENIDNNKEEKLKAKKDNENHIQKNKSKKKEKSNSKEEKNTSTKEKKEKEKEKEKGDEKEIPKKEPKKRGRKPKLDKDKATAKKTGKSHSPELRINFPIKDMREEENKIIIGIPSKIENFITKFEDMKKNLDDFNSKLKEFNIKIEAFKTNKNDYDEIKKITDKSKQEIQNIYSIMKNGLNSLNIFKQMKEYDKNIYNAHKNMIDCYQKYYADVIGKTKSDFEKLSTLEKNMLLNKKEIKEFYEKIITLHKDIFDIIDIKFEKLDLSNKENDNDKIIGNATENEALTNFLKKVEDLNNEIKKLENDEKKVQNEAKENTDVNMVNNESNENNTNKENIEKPVEDGKIGKIDDNKDMKEDKDESTEVKESVESTNFPTNIATIEK